MYWAQVWLQAPELSQRSRLSWERRNPGWTVLAMDLPAIDALLGPDWRKVDLPDSITPTALFNLVRLALLERFGGVWADATTFCVRPLDEWIDRHAESGFFAFDRPGPDRDLATWFLAARQGSTIIRRCGDASWTYWDGRTEMDEFHWEHKRFRLLLQQDSEFAKIWAGSAPITAVNPLHFGPGKPVLQEPPKPKTLELLREGAYPVVKLTNRLSPGPPDSIANYIMRTLSAETLET